MNLVVRADASSSIGVGHVMRCLALAQACQDEGGRVTFVMADGAGQLGDRLRRDDVSVIEIDAELGGYDDAEQTLELCRRADAEWIVLDGYHFDAEMQKCLKDGGARVLAIDDFGQATHYSADLVLNQNAHASADFYESREPACRLLLGLQYALLRREFRTMATRRNRASKREKRVLLTFGGADPDNVTGAVLRALERVRDVDIEAVLVVGASNPHRAELVKLCDRTSRRVTLLTNVVNMTELYASVDVAITGGGTTLWELAFMGVPAITMILADNQEPSSRKLDQLGVVRCLGLSSEVSQKKIAEAIIELCENHEARASMTTLGRRLVDGRGALRVLQEMSTTTAERGE
jgi:UDP-2,4-diacetamido-2,4,6-trideoxy-beta-L-altropyranose hydrolase